MTLWGACMCMSNRNSCTVSVITLCWFVQFFFDHDEIGYSKSVVANNDFGVVHVDAKSINRKQFVGWIHKSMLLGVYDLV